ncbi:uncharacterized protein K489DRAFT_423437 [Dissoconium aciculare CBS 342.82]|uniref:Uncharacterized protein n=1 Tax=Dissoconium aciculare CBS 342.82 TaxID=1314786 RepID=A0A6J3M5D4_9PEZI|nr:uncharacterized protein K489DRAFT_423437 [Dissoconium aciculare CBS 342.82]KAF1823260.1 hypothetical protein K489DRAFT_423437 [Dissoconium aciculare CBS 342.82]
MLPNAEGAITTKASNLKRKVGFIAFGCVPSNHFDHAVACSYQQRTCEAQQQSRMWIPVPNYKENVAIIAQRAHGMCQNFAEECDYSFHHLGSNALLPEDCSAAKSMLHMSMRPLQYEAALVGMSFAFTCLHQTLASAEHELFSASERKRLEKIAEQEFQGLRVWMGQVDDPLVHKMWAQGFEAGKKEIEKCFVGA